MKFSFLINSFAGGGAERVVQTLAEELINKGHEVEIVLLEKSKMQYELPIQVKVTVLKTSFLNRGIGKLLTIPIQAWIYARYINSTSPDNSVSLLVRSNLINIISQFFGNRQRIIISERNNSKEQYKQGINGKIMKILLKNLYPKANKVIAISHGVKESLSNFNVQLNRVEVIHNPQHLEYIRSQSKKNTEIQLPNSEFKVVTMGRLIAQKDHYTLIKAFAIVQKHYSAHLIIIGEGPFKKSLEKLVSDLELSNKVSFLGWKKNPFSILRNCDLFVLSSSFEGFGNVLVEAMACKLPVISTDCISGPSEILDNGEYGVLTPVEDSNSLAKEIMNLLQDEKLRESFANKSESRAEEFSSKKITEQYIEFLRANQ